MINIEVSVLINGEQVQSQELNNLVAWFVKQKLVAEGTVGKFASPSQPVVKKSSTSNATRIKRWTPEEEFNLANDVKELSVQGFGNFQIAKELHEKYGRKLGGMDHKIRELKRKGRI